MPTIYVLSRNMKNIRIFYLKIFPFLVVKFSIYLNRRVFVMKWYHLLMILLLLSRGYTRDIKGASYRGDYKISAGCCTEVFLGVINNLEGILPMNQINNTLLASCSLPPPPPHPLG